MRTIKKCIIFFYLDDGKGLKIKQVITITVFCFFILEMLFSVPLNEFELDNIHFTKSKKNIIMNGLFTKILYSDCHIIMNGVYVNFILKIKQVHNNSYYTLDEKSKANQEMFSKIINIENDIILYYKKYMHMENMKSIFILKNQIEKGVLKYNQREGSTTTDLACKMRFILKISGLWQNENSIGLNYKIVSVSPQVQQ